MTPVTLMVAMLQVVVVPVETVETAVEAPELASVDLVDLVAVEVVEVRQYIKTGREAKGSVAMEVTALQVLPVVMELAWERVMCLGGQWLLQQEATQGQQVMLEAVPIGLTSYILTLQQIVITQPVVVVVVVVVVPGRHLPAPSAVVVLRAVVEEGVVLVLLPTEMKLNTIHTH